jgi:hypothetical protein
MTTDNAPFNEADERAAALAGDALAIEGLKVAVRGGQNWYLALLDAIHAWKSPSEEYNGELYGYLIGGEAFDWLRLAERLCEEIKDLVPAKEITDLLFFDRPPVEISEEEFKKRLGPAKYRAYLNFLYGVLTEQALFLATVYEIRKGRISPVNPEDEADAAFYRIYHAGQAELLEAFQKEMKYPRRVSLTLTEMKEFTYWLFKYRVKKSEKPKVASDTKKALSLMYRRMSPRAG